MMLQKQIKKVVYKTANASPPRSWIKYIKRQPCAPMYGRLYHYEGNNPVRYIDPDGRYLINNIFVFNNYGKSETAETYALSNFEEIRKTAGYSTRLGWWKVNGSFKLLPLNSTTYGFKNNVAFADKQTMSALKSFAASQKNKDKYAQEFVFAKVSTEKKENGVIAVNLTVSQVTTDYKNNVINETDPIMLTLAFTTEEELKLFKSRETGLRIMANDALQKANIELNFGVER